jgi:hypothetical protein
MLDARLIQERALMRRWVETWIGAGEELEKIRGREIQATDTREAVRQVFSAETSMLHPPSSTSGLVEQQALFARLRK